MKSGKSITFVHPSRGVRTAATVEKVTGAGASGYKLLHVRAGMGVVMNGDDPAEIPHFADRTGTGPYWLEEGETEPQDDDAPETSSAIGETDELTP